MILTVNQPKPENFFHHIEIAAPAAAGPAASNAQYLQLEVV
jgi:hypothetical protein